MDELLHGELIPEYKPPKTPEGNKSKHHFVEPPEIEEGNFGTLGQLTQWAIENNVPLHAEIVYAGCGSHRIAFEWEDE